MRRSISAEAEGALCIGRRGFLAAGAAAALLPSIAWAGGGGAAMAGTPVCALHNDQPWCDPMGQAPAYRPAAGARGAEVLAGLDETALRHAHCYL